jgi:DNA-binding transcriptional regulator/RsmH inhibitor MraZ
MSDIEGNFVPDVYSDKMELGINAFGVTLNWYLTGIDIDAIEQGQQTSKQVATIRTSHLHAKIIALLILKNLKKMEKDIGITVTIPEYLREKLEISEPDA